MEKSLTLSKEELTQLSDAILSQMSKLRNVKELTVSNNIHDAVNKEIKELKELNSKICELL